MTTTPLNSSNIARMYSFTRTRDEIKKEALEQSERILKTEGAYKAVYRLLECINFIGLDIDITNAIKKIAIEYSDHLDEKFYQTLQQFATQLSNERKYEEGIALLDGLKNEGCLRQLKELKAFTRSSPNELFRLAQTVNVCKESIWAITNIDNERIACGSISGELKVLNLRTGEGTVLRENGAPPLPRSFIYLSHENSLVCPGAPGTIEFWNPTARSKNVVKLKFDNVSITTILRLDTNRAYAQLASGNEMGDVDLWKLSNSDSDPFIWKTLTGHQGMNTCVTELDIGKIATCAMDGAVKIWNINAKEPSTLLRTLEIGSEVCEILSLPDKDKRVATLGSDRFIKIWKWETGELVTDLRGLGGTPSFLLRPRAAWLVTAASNTIEIFDYNTHYKVADLAGHTSTPLSAVPIIEDLTTKYLVSSSKYEDGSIKVWDLGSNRPNPTPLQTLEGHPGKNVILLAWGKSIVSAGSDGKIKVWVRV